MYAELRMELDSKEINFQQSSNFQGVIMEAISAVYAARLHGNQLNPYSQCILKENDKVIWSIKTLNEEAYENIILSLSKCSDITLKKRHISIPVYNKTVQMKEEKELIKEFYEKKCPKYLEMKFQTSTSFKRDGKYVIYPDLRLIYSSLMRKYSAASQEFEMFDEETLEALVEQSEIVRYRLQTIPFPLEKIKITGFVGNICIHVKGPETMARYIRMLLEFGEFSGVGIKTGMGMGAMRYIRRNEND